MTRATKYGKEGLIVHINDGKPHNTKFPFVNSSKGPGGGDGHGLVPSHSSSYGKDTTDRSEPGLVLVLTSALVYSRLDVTLLVP